MPRKSLPLVLAASLTLLPHSALPGADGDPDTTFWSDGKVVLSNSDSFEVSEVLTAPTGRAVVVGTHLVPGGADEWFWRTVGSTSSSTTCYFFPPGGATSGRANAARFDAAGRLVVAGSASYGGSRLAVARFDYPDCALDSGFDGDGYYTLDVPGGTEELMAMATSPIGILTFGGYRNDPTDNDIVVLQLNDAGAPVNGFSGNGWLTLDVTGAELDDGVFAVAVDAQNRVVAGGSTHYGADGANSDFIVARFTPAGALDSSFDSDGIARVAFDLGGADRRYDDAYAMALDPASGAIVLAGIAQTLATTDLAIARLTPAGAPDSSFSGDGKVNNNFGFAYVRLNAVLVDGLGRITAAGVAEPYAGSAGGDFFAVRYLRSGAVDSSFSGNGWTTVGFDVGPSGFEHDRARSAAFGPGRLVLAGEAERDSDYNDAYALARLEISLLFADGFENGQTSAWSSASGGGP